MTGKTTAIVLAAAIGLALTAGGPLHAADAPAPSTTAPPSVPVTLILRSGMETCGAWVNANPPQNMSDWLAGFWTGMNLNNPRRGNIGNAADFAATVQRVRTLCVSQPDMPIAKAAQQTYLAMESQGQ